MKLTTRINGAALPVNTITIKNGCSVKESKKLHTALLKVSDTVTILCDSDAALLSALYSAVRKKVHLLGIDNYLSKINKALPDATGNAVIVSDSCINVIPTHGMTTAERAQLGLSAGLNADLTLNDNCTPCQGDCNQLFALRVRLLDAAVSMNTLKDIYLFKKETVDDRLTALTGLRVFYPATSTLLADCKVDVESKIIDRTELTDCNYSIIKHYLMLVLMFNYLSNLRVNGTYISTYKTEPYAFYIASSRGTTNCATLGTHNKVRCKIKIRLKQGMFPKNARPSLPLYSRYHDYYMQVYMDSPAIFYGSKHASLPFYEEEITGKPYAPDQTWTVSYPDSTCYNVDFLSPLMYVDSPESIQISVGSYPYITDQAMTKAELTAFRESYLAKFHVYSYSYPAGYQVMEPITDQEQAKKSARSYKANKQSGIACNIPNTWSIEILWFEYTGTMPSDDQATSSLTYIRQLSALYRLKIGAKNADYMTKSTDCFGHTNYIKF